MKDEDLFHLYPPDKYVSDPCPIESVHIKAIGEGQSSPCSGLPFPSQQCLNNIDQPTKICLADGVISISPPSHSPTISFLSRVKLKPTQFLFMGLIFKKAFASSFKHWRAWCSLYRRPLKFVDLTWCLGIRRLIFLPQIPLYFRVEPKRDKLKNLLRPPTLKTNIQPRVSFLTRVILVFCETVARKISPVITAWKTQRQATRGATTELLPLPVGTGSCTESALGRKSERKSLSPHEAVLFVLCTKHMVDRLTTLHKAHYGVKLLITPRFPTMAPNIYPREILDISVDLHFAATSSEAAGEAASLLRIGDG
jgi:hypothetical protein